MTYEELAEKLEWASKRIDTLEKQLETTNNRIMYLEARLAKYENPNTSPSQIRFRKKGGGGGFGRIGRPEGAEGSTRISPPPDETIEVTIPFCPECNEPLGDPLFVETRIIEEIPKPQPIKVTAYELACYRCKCGKELMATHPDCPTEGRFGPNLLAEVAMLCTEDRLPLRKARQSLKRRYGIEVTTAAIIGMLARIKDKLLPFHEEIRKNVKEVRTINIDETTFPVKGKDWWLWVFRTPNEVLFRLSSGRSRKTPEEVLGGYSHHRLIGTDGYSAYRDFGIAQRCWAHLIRQLKFMAEKYPRYEPLLQKLRDFFHYLKETLSTKPPPEERRNLFVEAKRWLEEFIAGLRRFRRLKKFIKYAVNGMHAWFTFVLYPEIEPTNNIAEQALREHVVQRRIKHMLRSEKGAKIYEVLATVVGTYRVRGLNPHEALAAALSS